MLGSARADIDELACGEALETLGGDVLLGQVAADETGVGLAYFDEYFARLMVRDASEVEAAVWIALAKYWDVEHMFRQDYTIYMINRRLQPHSSGSERKGGRYARRPTGRDRRVVRVRLRRVPENAA